MTQSFMDLEDVLEHAVGRDVYCVAKETMRIIRSGCGLKKCAVRLLYCGEHTMSKEDIIRHFRKTVHDVNSSYCEIPFRGLLLVYDSYFVHIVEGSEDTIHRQLRFLLKREEDYIQEMTKHDEEEAAAAAEAADPEDSAEQPAAPERKMFRRLKMLMVYHSITKRLFEDWRTITARPPTLVSKLDIYEPLPQHMEQLRVCLDKLVKLCDLHAADEELTFDGMNPVSHARIEALPEVGLLEFLLQSPYLLDLREVAFLHRRVDDYAFYFEKVWPLPTHFTPRHLYKLKIDSVFVEPLPVMPWELVKPEEDEEREQKSDSDESD